jgi:signal transduction histidine kinase
VRRHLSISLLVSISLGLLVILLGTLQYRWLSQISDAQRVQLQRTVSQQAEAYADDFNSELLRLYLTFRINSADLRPDNWGAFVHRYDVWHETTHYPEIVSSFYLVDVPGTERPGVDLPLQRYDPAERTFAPAAWPVDFGPVGERARQIRDEIAGHELTRGARPIRDPIVASVPALLIALLGSGSIEHTVPVAGQRPRTRTPDPSAPGERSDARLIVVTLDRAQLTTSVLPALAARHFPERDDTAPYRLAVIDPQAGRVVFSRDAPGPASSEWQIADVRMPLFSFRLDISDAIRRPLSSGVGRPSELQGRARPDGAFLGDGWQLVVRHTAGSLEAAISSTRRRNLWLGFGMLGVLAAGIALVVANARRSQQLASQQMDFVATVTHELRTPLAVIRSAAQNLSEGVAHDANQVAQYGRLIDAEGHRLTDMVEHVLELAGLAGSRPPTLDRPVDVGALALDVVASRQELFKTQGIEVAVQSDREIPLIAADEQALRRAIENLVINAMKHGADGRWIGISVRRVSHRGRDEVQLSVSDHGRGIDAADLPHIFQPFYRGREAVARGIQGSGFGLSLVRHIAEVHGGRVTVASRAGEETTFTLHLPIGRRSEILPAAVREV